MKYDATISSGTIEESPNAFRVLVYGACVLFCSQIYVLYLYLMNNDYILGFQFFLPGSPAATGECIDLPRYALFSTATVLVALLLCILLFTILLIRSGIKAWRNKESSFFFTVGLFAALFAFASIHYSEDFLVDVTIQSLIYWL